MLCVCVCAFVCACVYMRIYVVLGMLSNHGVCLPQC